jgi:hypothetical protein
VLCRLSLIAFRLHCRTARSSIRSSQCSARNGCRSIGGHLKFKASLVVAFGELDLASSWNLRGFLPKVSAARLSTG